MEEKVTKCSVSKKCGSCQYQGVPYKEQLAAKQKRMKKLLGKFANVKPIIGMDDPFYYRNKVHAVFDRDKKGNIICGTYEAKTHKVVPIEECMIEDKISQEIMRSSTLIPVRSRMNFQALSSAISEDFYIRLK